MVEDAETILQSALRQNIALPYSCKMGKCDTCIASAKVDGQAFSSIRTCTTVPNQDMTLEIDLLTELNDIQVKTLPCRIDSLEQVSEDIIILILRMPPNQALQFVAGQYIDLIRGDIRRSYSIASPPQDDKIELHIRRVEQGKFSEYLFEHAKVNDLLRLEGPFGTFFRRQASVIAKKSIIFLTGGTGFAPVQSMVKSMIMAKENTPIWIYWGNRDESGFYSSLPNQWAQDHTWIRYNPVCSETPNSLWQGKTGLVHKAVLTDFPDLSTLEVFACGSPAMIAAAKSDFIQAGLVPSAFYADAFLPSTS
jgi:CDP-4-dehydro-6-deoxyglucose reductase